jgi:hypothetical protein
MDVPIDAQVICTFILLYRYIPIQYYECNPDSDPWSKFGGGGSGSSIAVSTIHFMTDLGPIVLYFTNPALFFLNPLVWVLCFLMHLGNDFFLLFATKETVTCYIFRICFWQNLLPGMYDFYKATAFRWCTGDASSLNSDNWASAFVYKIP